MGLYGFKKRFVPFVLEGSKTHTIRAHRTHQDKPGDICHLYYALRTKQATLLGRFPCTKVEEIKVCLSDSRPLPFSTPLITVDGEILSLDECIALAWRDGFRDGPREQAFDRMMAFWEGRLPFSGQIIHWNYRLGEINGNAIDCCLDSRDVSHGPRG